MSALTWVFSQAPVPAPAHEHQDAATTKSGTVPPANTTHVVKVTQLAACLLTICHQIDQHRGLSSCLDKQPLISSTPEWR